MPAFSREDRSLYYKTIQTSQKNVHYEYSGEEKLFNTSLDYYYYFSTEHFMRLVFHRSTLGNSALKCAVQAILLSHHAHSPKRNIKTIHEKRQNVPVIILIASLYSPTSQVHYTPPHCMTSKPSTRTKKASHFCPFKSY